MIFTSPCEHAPLLPISIQHKGEGAPVAQDGIGHRALKKHEKKATSINILHLEGANNKFSLKQNFSKFESYHDKY